MNKVCSRLVFLTGLIRSTGIQICMLAYHSNKIPSSPLPIHPTPHVQVVADTEALVEDCLLYLCNNGLFLTRTLLGEQPKGGGGGGRWPFFSFILLCILPGL